MDQQQVCKYLSHLPLVLQLFFFHQFLYKMAVFSKSLKINRLLYTKMAEGSVNGNPASFQHQNERKSACPDASIKGVSMAVQKHEECSQLRGKNILESQLTQENSGISYAFKAHLLILTFQRLKARRVARCFNALRKPSCKICRSEIQAAANQKQGGKYKSTIQLGEQKHLPTLQRSLANPQPLLDGPQYAQINFLQEFNLKSSHKFLNRQLFQWKVKTNLLEKRVACLESELSEAQRRQEREMIKKRQSLESLAEELGEKNEVIEELKGIVKGLKAKLNSKQNTNGCILEEDSDSLRRSLLHIQGVNDRLNYDLARTKESEKNLQEQLKSLNIENDKLKGQVNRLREEVFAVDSIKEQVDLSKKQCGLWERRLKARQERLSIVEKRINELSRSKGKQSTHFGNNYLPFCTEKRLEKFNTSEISQSPKEFEFTTKLEAIFGFLFHIEDPKYELHSSELFDEEQRELLLSQKLKITNMLESNSKSDCLTPIKSKKLQQSQINNDFGCTILQLIERQSVKPVATLEKSSAINEKQQIQTARLREKIGELKDQQLFVRSVLLSFIKSLELRSIKKESQNILELLYDAFEYSEEERRSIFQPKSRKLFGFI